MSKLKKAAELSFNKWCEELEEKMQIAIKNGEIPQKTEEELKQEAQKIWELAHKEDNK